MYGGRADAPRGGAWYGPDVPHFVRYMQPGDLFSSRDDSLWSLLMDA
jgi:hypothetical protein